MKLKLWWLALLGLLLLFFTLPQLIDLSVDQLQPVTPLENHSHEEIVDEDFYHPVSVEPQVIEKAGYRLELSNPRYQHHPDYGPSFVIDILITNLSFEPFVAPGGNCDLVHDGVVVRSGVGLMLSEITNVYPGESLKWQMISNYQDERQVSRCIYSPTNSYDPAITSEFFVTQFD